MRNSNLPSFVFPPLRDYVYLWHDPVTHCHQICGVTFQEFLRGVEFPVKLLLLRHRYPYPATDSRGNFEIVEDDAELASLARDDIYGYGDFWWIDVLSQDALNQIRGAELLELLYLKQFGQPLGGFRFPTLGNRFAYFAHDDGWHTRLYVDQDKRLESILAQVLTNKYLAFSGRRSHPVPNPEIMSDLIVRTKRGARILLDFSKVDANTSSVPIYSTNDVQDLNRIRDRVVAGELLQDHPGREFGHDTFSPTYESLVVDGERWTHERLA